MGTESLKFEIYERGLLSPLRGHNLSSIESFVADLLLGASSAVPMDGARIAYEASARFDVEINERRVKDIIRTLRKDHHFPILARRKKPSGYWWCASKEEMKEFIETFKSQALDELHTLSKIVNENYPELAGQLKLEDL